jgi:hypothetical protein
MSNTASYGGFKCFQIIKRASMYAIPTAPTINLCCGDLVQGNLVFINTTKYGAIPACKVDAVITTTDGATHPIYGSILAIFDSNGDPMMYMPAATVGDGTVAGYALVADDPYQVFVAQGDGIFTAADMTYNYEVTPATLNASTMTSLIGLSYMQIKAASGDTVTATIPIRLLGQAFPETESIASAYAKMICQINPGCHYRGAFTAI